MTLPSVKKQNMHLSNAFDFFETCRLNCKNMKFGSISSQEASCLEI